MFFTLPSQQLVLHICLNHYKTKLFTLSKSNPYSRQWLETPFKLIVKWHVHFVTSEGINCFLVNLFLNLKLFLFCTLGPVQPTDGFSLVLFVHGSKPADISWSYTAWVSRVETPHYWQIVKLLISFRYEFLCVVCNLVISSAVNVKCSDFNVFNVMISMWWFQWF